MKRAVAGFAGAFGMLTLAFCVEVSTASATQDESSDPVVLRVGRSHTVTASAVERRLSKVPPYQLSTFGTSTASAVRNFLQRVITREALLDAASETDSVPQDAATAWTVRKALADTLLANLRKQSSTEVSEDDARRYFEQNRARYRQPERLLLWRIVVPTENDAQTILQKVQGADGIREWRRLAREASVDPSNRLRGGDLGFVDASGQTQWPRVRVNPIVFESARTVADGALVPRPIPLDGQFCVIWRRGSLRAVEASFDELNTQIVQELVEARALRAQTKLLDSLRGQHLTDHNPEPTTQLPASPPLQLNPSNSERAR